MANGATIAVFSDWQRVFVRQGSNLVECSPFGPSELLVTIHLFVLLRFSEQLGVFVLQPLPFADLLVETEIAA